MEITGNVAVESGKHPTATPVPTNPEMFIHLMASILETQEGPAVLGLPSQTMEEENTVGGEFIPPELFALAAQAPVMAEVPMTDLQQEIGIGNDELVSWTGKSSSPDKTTGTSWQAPVQGKVEPFIETAEPAVQPEEVLENMGQEIPDVKQKGKAEPWWIPRPRGEREAVSKEGPVLQELSSYKEQIPVQGRQQGPAEVKMEMLEANFSKIQDAIVQEFSTMKNGEQTTMKVQLKPEHLGKVELDLSLQDGKLTARIQVENDQVKSLFQDNMGQLQQLLQRQDLQVSSIQLELIQRFSGEAADMGRQGNPRQEHKRQYVGKNRWPATEETGFLQRATGVESTRLNVLA